ncbi:MAG: CpaF family protein, partial [Chloroflexota bacterium]|nr:CpaF family protein [Chloroflexota bacterium]
MTSPQRERSRHQTNLDVEKVKVYLKNSLTQKLESNPPAIGERREIMLRLLGQLYQQTKLNLADSLREQIFRDILDDLLGYGPIQTLLDDASVSEVMVNGPDKVYVERDGKLTKTKVTFRDNDHVIKVIDSIIL